MDAIKEDIQRVGGTEGVDGGRDDPLWRPLKAATKHRFIVNVGSF